MLNFLVSLILIAQPVADTTHPVLTWEPETPAWGDTLTLTYHHDAPTALIKGPVPIYANIRGGEVLEFKRSGDLSTAQFVTPDSISMVQIYFYSLDEWDRYASAQILLNTPEGWSSVEEEMAGIRNVIFMASVGRGSKEQAEAVLDSLAANPVDHPKYYYVLTDGYMRMGYPDSGWAALSYLKENYSGTDEYAMALGAYDYNVYTNPDLTTPERMETLVRWIDDELKVTNYSYLVMNVGPRWDNDSTHLTLKKREKILTRLVKQSPSNPLIRSLLASHYAHAGDTTTAIEEYSKSINDIIEGTSAKAGNNINPGGRKLFLDRWVLARGELHAGQKQYFQALADFAYVIQLNQNKQGEAYFEQAKVYQSVEHYKSALDCFVKALGAGHTDARTAAENIYLLLNNTREGFDDWLATTLAPDKDDTYMTTDFAFVDLEGNPGRWFDYRGKIVVVNIWGLGCGPCKREIPDLNKLVAEYQGKPVVFVAFSGDDPEALKEYLADHPFDYSNLIRKEPGVVTKSFRFSGVLPWHGVVDPHGQVRFSRTGARDDNSDIKLIINQLIRESAVETESN